MRLNHEEQGWLNTYRKALAEQFPDLVKQVIIFGSKARGTATPDSDLDVLVIIREGDWQVKEEMAAPGYDLAIETEVVPSILVYTEPEWEERRRLRAPFWQAVDRDGVRIA